MIDTAPRKMDRQEAISSLKRKHEDYFRSQGISNPYFTLKYPYVPKNRDNGVMVVGMFPSEIKKGDDVYIELTDLNNIPVHATPVLYKLRYNPWHQEEFEMISDPSKGSSSERYLVPVSELELVSGNPDTGFSKPDPLPKPSTFIKEIECEDCHQSELTARDWACIHLATPQSNKKWLNKLIQSTSRQHK